MTAVPPASTVPAAPTAGADGVVDALALLAAGELASFARLATDAAHAPELRTRIVLSRMAAGDLAPLDRIEQALAGLGTPAEEVDDRIWQFRELLAEYDTRTTPRDWWERLVRTYVGYGVVVDVQRLVADGLDGEAAELASESLADNGLADFVVATLGPVIQAEPQLGARLALWGRRVVGEALGIASRLITTRPSLAAVAGITESGAGLSPEQHAAFMSRLTAGHARRMKRLELTA